MKDPAFLFYTGDFITGTMFMSDSEIGQYIRILCAQHQHGHIPPEYVSKICGGNPTALILSKFLKDSDGKYYNERLEIESIKRNKHSEKQRQNANMRWHCGGISTAMPLRNRNKDEDKRGVGREQALFDVFWTSYPKKVGKGAAAKAWSKIKDPSATLEKILHALEWQAESEQWKKENGQYIPNPATYLNRQHWLDEAPQAEAPGLTVDAIKEKYGVR